MDAVATSSPPKRSTARRWLLGSLILIATLACAVAVTWGVLEYRMNWDVVVPGKIYRSAQLPELLVRHQLAANRINTIVFLSQDDDDDRNIQTEKRVASELGVQFLNFPMMGDGVARPEQYTQALLAVWQSNQAGKTVLVHCHSGAQRTGGVIAVYRLLVEKKSPADVLAEMIHYGHDPRKNLTLLPFLNAHMGEWAEALKQNGVIDRVPDPLPQLVLPATTP